MVDRQLGSARLVATTLRSEPRTHGTRTLGYAPRTTTTRCSVVTVPASHPNHRSTI